MLDMRKLDGRSLYVLLKLGDQVLDRLVSYGDLQDGNVPLAVSLSVRNTKELKSAVQNVRYVLEQVTFEVQPPFTQAVHYAPLPKDGDR